MDELRVHSKTSTALIQNMQDGFIMVDPSGEVITANPRVLDLFEVKHSIEGKNIICLHTDSEFLEKTDYAIKGVGDTMTLTKNERVVQLSFLPSANQGAIILASDITEKDQAEKMRKEFSANVSHELKTPLTTIGGYAEIIMEGIAKPEDIVNFAGKINSETKRLIHLIENILIISKLDEQDTQKSFERCDIAQIAAEAAEGLSYQAEKQQVQISTETAPCIMDCNKILIYEMLMNLISNAIQYNIPKGSISVKVREAERLEEGRFCHITVSDTGIGIPKEEQPRVFERFYRVEQSRDRKTGGAGLGLSIVNHIVRTHKGSIELTSEQNKGLQMDIYLPM
jgi:two-component system phosphate regulon sensor histidine kinase PhoR